MEKLSLNNLISIFPLMSVIRQKIFSNHIWLFLERTGAQLVSFIVAIVLARLLTPEDL